MFNNKGISPKNGKPFENYKCSDKDCGYIEWVDLKKETSQNTSQGFKKIDFEGQEKLKEYIENMGLALEKRLKKIEEMLEIMTKL
jgi:hypothetical protein